MILVVGGAGFIGSHLLKVLRGAGEPHLVLDDFSQGHRQALQNSPYVHGDLGDTDLVRTVLAEHRVDLVMHFGAFISVGESVREPAKYWKNNTAKTLSLMTAMNEAGVKKLVFSSTAAIFGEPAYVPIDEAHPKRPASPYGASKLAVEQMLADFDKGYGFKSVCLRYFNAAGADPDGELGEDHRPEEHLIPVAILAALGQRPTLNLFGTDYDTPDGTCVRDYVHILDLARAHVLAAEHLRSGGDSRAYNLGSGEGFSVRQVIQTVERVTGRSVPVQEAGRRPGDPATLIAGSARIRSEWDWRPKYDDLDVIVGHAWNWMCAHPGGYRE